MRSCVIMLALTTVLTAAAHAQTAEHRGVWMPSATYNTPERADASIARAAAANLNVLYPLVWGGGGQAWFKSDLSPLAATVEPQFDPLGYLLAAAHARGMQVHPWFVSGSAGNYPPGSLPDRHPEWLVRGSQPMQQAWYDLSQPEVRQFQTDVMIDLLRRYPVDGLHFDYIRFSSQLYCYCDWCREEFARLSGLPPLDDDPDDFPVWLTMAGNPLAEPTTAQVLAQFEDGGPAITLNRVGAGQVALVNWQVARFSNPAVREAIAIILRRFGAEEGTLYQLRATPTAAQDRARAWFEELGFPATPIAPADLVDLAAPATVLLYAQYEIDADTAAALERLVEAGGRCLFIEGPVRSMELPALQELTGLRRSGAFFYALRMVAPAPDQDLIAARCAVDLDRERTRLRRWVQYRKDSVTQLVRMVSEQAKEVNPQVRISAAVFPNRLEAEGVCQDWYGWLEEGILDYAVPMAYTADNAHLGGLLREWQAADPLMERIIPGLAIYMTREGRDVSRPDDLVVSQVELCRSRGARGIQFFSLPFLGDELAGALTSGPFHEVATPYQPAYALPVQP